MSLIAPLLSVPGRVRKLRGNNAPKLPAAESIAPTVTQAGNFKFTALQQVNPSSQISRLPQAYETHSAFAIAANNAVEASEEACNITGKGSIHGVWMLYSGQVLATTRWGKFGASIVVDGVELVDQTWEFDSRIIPVGEPASVVSLDVYGNAVLIPLIGTMWFEWNFENAERVVSRDFVPLLKPLVFDDSLVINLVHKESEAASGQESTISMRLCAAVYEDA